MPGRSVSRQRLPNVATDHGERRAKPIDDQEPHPPSASALNAHGAKAQADAGNAQTPSNIALQHLPIGTEYGRARGVDAPQQGRSTQPPSGLATPVDALKDEKPVPVDPRSRRGRGSWADRTRHRDRHRSRRCGLRCRTLARPAHDEQVPNDGQHDQEGHTHGNCEVPSAQRAALASMTAGRGPASAGHGASLPQSAAGRRSLSTGTRGRQPGVWRRSRLCNGALRLCRLLNAQRDVITRSYHDGSTPIRATTGVELSLACYPLCQSRRRS